MFKNLKSVSSHILILALSAAIALSLPYTGKFIAENYLTYWVLIEAEKIFLISVEIAVAVVLIIFFSFLGRSWEDRKYSDMAMIDMGLVLVSHREKLSTRKKVRAFKQQQGNARDMLLVGTTGSSTFVEPEGDLHGVIQNCREAKIMLLHPESESASIRARSIPGPGTTPESFRNQIIRSIGFLKSLKAQQKKIRLKLYEETPFLKLVVLGDYLFMKHYCSGLNGQDMPEYIFKHSPNHSGMFHLFYQFFLLKWRDPNNPEYDFDSDELVYRDNSGNEVKRAKFAMNTNTLEAETI